MLEGAGEQASDFLTEVLSLLNSPAFLFRKPRESSWQGSQPSGGFLMNNSGGGSQPGTSRVSTAQGAAAPLCGGGFYRCLPQTGQLGTGWITGEEVGREGERGMGAGRKGEEGKEEGGKKEPVVSPDCPRIP